MLHIYMYKCFVFFVITSPKLLFKEQENAAFNHKKLLSEKSLLH